MTKDDEAFFKKLVSTFKAEAEDRIQKISLSLLELEKKQSEEQLAQLVESVYRELHSLKSAARAVKIFPVENLCQKLESIFALWKSQKIKLTDTQFDLLHNLIARIDPLIQSPLQNTLEFQKQTENLLQVLESSVAMKSSFKTSSDAAMDADIIQNKKTKNRTKGNKSRLEAKKKKHSENPELIQHIEQDNPLQSHESPEPFAQQEKTIKISSHKLDRLLVQAEEMLAAKLNLSKIDADLNELKNDILVVKKINDKMLSEKFYFNNTIPGVDVSLGSQNALLNKLWNYVANSESTLKNLVYRSEILTNHFEQNMRNFTIGIDNLLEDSKKMMLLPFSTALNILPVTVRNLANSLGKKVVFQLSGTELEIDKRILEEMKDVLIHIIRNAIDHGIESEAERKLLNKPEAGSLSIDIQHMTGNEIQLFIQDDGRGVDIEKVKNAAVRLGHVSKKDVSNLSDNEASMLIFQSGISTNETVTDLSGRGLGMSIIREKIEKVGGKIIIESTPNKGMTTKIILPLTLATFKGLLIRVSDQVFIVPTVNLERIISVPVESIKSIENTETIIYEKQVLSLLHLADVLGIKRKIEQGLERTKLLVLILVAVEHSMAFIIDEVLNESEILVKPFSYPIVKIKYISAAAILGTGIPIPILNTLDLLQYHHYSENVSKNKESLEKNEGKKKRILLVEDSITTRMLIKNILELEGFQVTTAVDGLDAWGKIREYEFELIVSDIEMPNMNGFELTQKIRNDKKLNAIPIVLVTTLETQKDREMGIDLGANAYILKSSFDSGYLVDVINKLI